MAEMDFMLCKLQIPNVCCASISALSFFKSRCVSFAMYFLAKASTTDGTYVHKIQFRFCHPELPLSRSRALLKVDIFSVKKEQREINSIWKLLLLRSVSGVCFLAFPPHSFFPCFPTERKKTNLLFSIYRYITEPSREEVWKEEEWLNHSKVHRFIRGSIYILADFLPKKAPKGPKHDSSDLELWN